MARNKTAPDALPRLECDLVMKGGVTSGVVYPAAIAAIAKDYRIRSVGGTSAGAIAAAGAAAMEFGRQSGRNPDARIRLETLSEQLGAREADVSLLSRLFQPDRGLPAQLGQLLGIGAGVPGARARVMLSLAGLPLAAATAIAAAVALVFVAMLPTGSSGGLQAGLGIGLFLMTWLSFAIVLLAVRNALFVSDAARAVVRAGFGLCSGMAQWSGRGEPSPSLSGWLHDRIQELAGLESDLPLCFGDLWMADHAGRQQARRARFAERCAAPRLRAAKPAGPGDLPREIELVLVASDVSRGHSVQLPFLRHHGRFFFRRKDLEELFPADVVNWMVDHAQQADLTGVELNGLEPDELFRLPRPEDLPILFAVRMSMSFPFLFRAVRLYVLRRCRPNQDELAEVWLADGGLTSNFPLQLFDSPLPNRPTFCLNLLYPDDEVVDEPVRRPAARAEADGPPAADGTPDAAADETAAVAPEASDEVKVYMLRTNYGRLEPYVRLHADGELGTLVRYGRRLVDTARNWNDNELIDVPGYRDRIVHIRMGEGEGGYSFDMSDALLRDLQRRGAFAGHVIARRFLPGARFDPLYPDHRLVLNWSNHRMARLRSWLAGVEVAAARFAAAWENDIARGTPARRGAPPVVPTIADMVEGRQSGADGASLQYYGYPFRNTGQSAVADEMITALRDIGARARGKVKVGVDYVDGVPSSPRPKSLLRLRPLGDADPRALRP